MVTGFTCLNYAVSSFFESPFHIHFFFLRAMAGVVVVFVAKISFSITFPSKKHNKILPVSQTMLHNQGREIEIVSLFCAFSHISFFFFARALKPQSGKNCLGNRAGEMRPYPFHFPIKKSVIISAKFNGPFLLRRDVWKLAGFRSFHLIQQSNAPFFPCERRKGEMSKVWFILLLLLLLLPCGFFRRGHTRCLIPYTAWYNFQQEFKHILVAGKIVLTYKTSLGEIDIFWWVNLQLSMRLVLILGFAEGRRNGPSQPRGK